MVIAVLTTLSVTHNWMLIVLGVAVGGTVGAVVARRIQMTAMPELVAAMHSLVGLAAVLIAFAAVHNPGAYGILTADDVIPRGNRLELFIGTFVGAITFSGSVIAFGKLSGRIRSAPVAFGGQHWLNLVLAIVMIAFGIAFMFNQSWTPFAIMTAIAFVLGVLIIIPIGGADMPVVISMLNSYSGWAAAGIGFSLNNPMLIISGSLVGSSGAILSYIMCKAMNRSFFNVILGGFGGGDAAAATGDAAQRTYRSGSAEDGFPAGQRRVGRHRPGLRTGSGPRPARGEGNGGKAARKRRESPFCHPPGRRTHARTHERAAGGSGNSL
jgi:NAD(P) transhydrogenase subunit beta